MTSQNATPATGQFTTDGRPHGYSTITPFLPLRDPDAAVRFYQEVFGAVPINRTEMGGRVVHAELALSSGRLQLGAAVAGLVELDPDEPQARFTLSLYCPDVDAVLARATDRGGVVLEDVTGFVSGDRFGVIRDPFGVRWAIMTRVEDLSDEESDARVKQWAAEQSGV